jgi:hypothetical protein
LPGFLLRDRNESRHAGSAHIIALVLDWQPLHLTAAGCFELGAGAEIEFFFQFQFSYELVDRPLSMLMLDFCKDQPGRIAVIAATHADLELQ